MEKGQLSRKLAVILHADVVGSTLLVQKDEALAHERIQNAFSRFSETISAYGGRTRELRGDALVAEFTRASDAVCAALLFQRQNQAHNESISDEICPALRIGISLGEVIVADGTITGEGIVLAQRLEQLAEAGGIVVQGTVSETVPDRLGFQFGSLGEVQLKGFEQPIRVFTVRLADSISIPEPDPAAESVRLDNKTPIFASRVWLSSVALIVVVALVGVLAWNSAIKKGASDLPPLPSGPRIAVMPFEPGDPFSNGMTEDLIASLSKFSSMLVLPSIATSKLQQEGADCKTIREVLDASFILDGTVRRLESQLRINVSLVNAIDCSQLWAENFDRELTVNNLFSTTDEVVYTIASITGYASSRHDTLANIIRTNNPDDLDVYDCVLKASWYFKTWSPEDHKDARDCLEWAVEQEPNYAKVKTTLAKLYIFEFKNRYAHRYPSSLERANRLLESADRIKPNSDDVYHVKALLAFFTAECGSYDKFYVAAEKAIEINPNNFGVVGEIAVHIGYSGQYDRSIALLEHAKKLSPIYPDWVYVLPMLNGFRTGEYSVALSYYEEMGPGLANHHMVKTLLAATYSRQGELAKAREIIAQLTDNHPQFVDDPRQPFLARRMEPDLIKSIMEGLRAAGHYVPPKAESDRC
jgi:adenylate cyclase